MAKTVSSAGLQDFIATGKPTQVYPNDQTSKAMASKQALNAKLAAVDSPAPETKAPETPPSDAPKEPEKHTEQPKPPEEDTGLEPEDHDLAERAQKRIGKKHYEMKKAQEEAQKAREEADESERFAESLFNEREMWRKRAEEAERKTTPDNSKPKEPELKEPDINDPQYKNEQGQFDWQKYSKDLAKYAATQAISEDRAKQAEESQKQARESAEAATRERVAKAIEKYPDWQKKVGSSPITLQQECLRYLAESEYGMDIAYHLASNPKDAERIRSMSPYLAVAELGKLQTQFEKPANPPAPAASKTVEPPAKPASAAPAPITPISTSGSGSIVLDPAKMDFKQLRAYHRERRKTGQEK